MNAIELKGVNKKLGSFAIQDLSLTVPMGTICGLVGENGAGKSTAIRLLMNAIKADSPDGTPGGQSDGLDIPPVGSGAVRGVSETV